MSASAPSRRHVLQLLLASATSLLVSGIATSAAADECALLGLDDLDLDAVRRLGDEYLNARPDQQAVTDASAFLKKQPGDAATLERLREKVSADFAAGRTVNLSGWFVSETEAGLFAAISRCGSLAP